MRLGEGDAAKSVGCGITFSRDLLGKNDVRAGLTMLCDTVGARLRHNGLYCSTVQVQIKNPALRVISRQKRLDTCTDSTKEILDAAISIVEGSWNMAAPIRMLTVTAMNLNADGALQMDLFDTGGEKRQKSRRLDSAVDSIRAKFGMESISYGNTLSQDIVHKRDEGED